MSDDGNFLVADISKFISFGLNKEGTCIVAKVKTPLPISIEIDKNISFHSTNNIVIYTDEKLHFNPEYPNRDVVPFIDIDNFNSVLDDIDKTITVRNSCSIENKTTGYLIDELNSLKKQQTELTNSINLLEEKIYACSSSSR